MNRWRWQRGLRIVGACLFALTFLLLGSLGVSAEAPAAAGTATATPPVVTLTPISEDMVEPAVMSDVVIPTVIAQPSPTLQPAGSADSLESSANLITNGSFEDGFSEGDCDRLERVCQPERSGRLAR